MSVFVVDDVGMDVTMTDDIRLDVMDDVGVDDDR